MTHILLDDLVKALGGSEACKKAWREWCMVHGVNPDRIVETGFKLGMAIREKREREILVLLGEPRKE